MSTSTFGRYHTLRVARRASSAVRGGGLLRSLRFEPLEDRRLLSLSGLSDSLWPAEPAGGPLPSQATAWEGYVGGGEQETTSLQLISGVPAYDWQHGCGPTAAGMVIGYWDQHGFENLIAGNSSTQTTAVNTAIASPEHYDDYSLPIDDRSTGLLADKSQLGGAHSPNNCLADWMHTSWSSDGNFYGWSFLSRVDDAIDTYASAQGYAGFAAHNETWGDFTWADFTAEIDANRPMVFLVDTDGDAATDHFVTAIGYDEATSRYACYDTWDASVHWYDFQQVGAGRLWGIYGATFVTPPADVTPPTVTSTTPDFATSGTLDAGTTSIQIHFSEAVVGADVATNYRLQALGPDALLGTADDTIVPLSVTYADNTATLKFAAMSESVYRLTVLDTIADVRLNNLDGNCDGTSGGDWTVDFTVLTASVSYSSPAVLTVDVRLVGGVVVDDFNLDGNPDIAVTGVTGSSGAVAVLLGDGCGRFSVAGTFLSGGCLPYEGAAADFNGDGNVDLAVTNWSSGSIGVLSGDGIGGFSAPTTFSSGGSIPMKIVAGDLNMDGRPDLVVANSDSSTVGILLSKEGGAFESTSTYSLGGDVPYDVKLGDFNADGKLDLLVAHSSTKSSVTILLGDGCGGFSDAVPVNCGDYSSGISIGYFNADQELDFAVMSGFGVRVMLNDGSLGFTPGATVDFHGVCMIQRLAADDFNSDGNLDLAVLGTYKDVGILLGDGSGQFAPVANFNCGVDSMSRSVMAVGDFDSDSRPDLAISPFPKTELEVLLNTSTPRPLKLRSSHSVVFDVAAGTFGIGQLIQAGSANVFNGYGRLLVGGTAFQPETWSCTLSDNGQSVMTAEGTFAGLTVSREITVPNTGNEDFARTVDVFTNPTDTAITTTVRIVGNLGSDAATTVWTTSDGDTLVETTDQWIGTDDADGSGTPAIIHYIHGLRGARPTSVTVTGDNIEWTYELTVDPGDTARLTYFTILADARTDAEAAAATLVTATGFGGQAAAFLTAAELESLANFDFPSAPGAPDLVAQYDTGSSSDDNLTRLDNSDATKVLAFDVSNTIAGATVTIYADGTAIGSTVATADGVTRVTTSGTVDLADGSHTITARQTEAGGIESLDSAALTIQIDTAPPVIVSTTPTLDQGPIGPISSIDVTFSEPIDLASFGPEDVRVVGGDDGITELSRYGGVYEACVVVGDRLYAATTNGLAIFDVSVSASPTLLGSYNTLENALDVAVAGSLAYVACGYGGLEILDVSDPAAVVRLGAYAYDGNARGVEVAGNHAYVTGSAGLKILDVTVPGSVVLLGSYWAGYDQALEVVGSVVYVLDSSSLDPFDPFGSRILRILDVSAPAAVTLLGQYDVLGAQGLDVVGSRAYVTYTAVGLPMGGGLLILDVSDPAAITSLGGYQSGYSDDVEVVGSLAYVVKGDSIEILDVSDPHAVVRRGAYDTHSSITQLRVAGGLGYVVDYSYGFQIYDLSQPAAVVRLGGYDTVGAAYGVMVAGSIAYVTDGSTGLQILDVSAPGAAMLLGEYTPGGHTGNVEVVGDLAYLARGSQGLSILDVSNPGEVIQVAWSSYQAFNVHVVGSLAYVAGVNSLQVLDVSTPASVHLLGCYATDGSVNHVQVVGNLAYVAVQSSGLEILDITDPGAVVRLGGYESSGDAYDLAVVGSLVYFADGSGGLQILDVSDPAAVVHVGAYDSYSREVEVVGNLAYVADGDVQILDVSDPGNVVLLCTCETTGYAYDVAVAGSLAYVADDRGGLKILRVNQPAAGVSHVGGNTYRIDLGQTLDEGEYVLQIGPVIDDAAGNAMDQELFARFHVDATPPAGYIDISGVPYPVHTAVGTVTIVFSEAVKGLDLADLTLTLDGGPDLLAGSSATLATSDGGITWTLSALESLTTAGGTYELKLAAVGSAVTDLVGNALSSDVTRQWTLDPVPLVVVSTSPALASGPIGPTSTIDVTFSEPIDPASFGLEDVRFSSPAGFFAGQFARSVTVGSLLYAATSCGLQILDVSDPLHPTRVGAYTTVGSACDVQVVGSLAYVGEDQHGLQILDVSNPAAPIRVGGYEGSGYAHRVQVVGNLAYVSDSQEPFNVPNSPTSLLILDVSDPTAPVRVGRFDMSDVACGVEVVGSLAYVAESHAGLHILDVSDPASPVRVGGFDIASDLCDLQVVGNHAYVLGWDGVLQILDVSAITAPVWLGEYAAANADAVQVVGDLAYLAQGSTGLEIIDVSDPATPVRLGGLDTAGGATGVDVVGSVAYVSDGGSGLQIVNVSSAASPVLLGRYEPGAVQAVQVTGNTAYVAAGSAGLQILDVTNPMAITLLSTFDTVDFALDVRIAGNLAYVADGSGGLQILDVSDPRAPTFVGAYAESASSVEVVGNRVYMINGGLDILDVSDPASPVRLGGYDPPGMLSSLREVEIVGQLAYAVDRYGKLQILDVSDPASPVVVGQYDGGASWANDVDIVDNLAYFLDANNLMILDVSNPAAPTLVGQCGAESAIGIKVIGNLAYLLNYTGRLNVFDVSNPASPVFLRAVGHSSGLEMSIFFGANTSFQVVDDLAYLPDLADGAFKMLSWNSAPVSISHVVDNTYRLDFGQSLVSGEHDLEIGPAIADLAGNAMDEAFFARFQVYSITPGTPDLVTQYDTGSSSDDNLTRFDNSSAAQVLAFDVSGTLAGATVTVYADGFAIGSAVATADGITRVTTSGTVDLADGSHTITARQTVGGGIESLDSTSLVIQVDTGATRLTGIYAAGSGWKQPFLDVLETAGVGDAELGYRLVDGADQLAKTSTVTWSNVNTLRITFSESVAVTEDSLTLHNSLNETIASTSFAAIDASTYQWTFATLGANKYWIALESDLTADLAGNALDGEWTTSTTTYANSGNGVAGGDCNFRFNLLPGDVNLSAGVNSTDVAVVRNRGMGDTDTTNYRRDLNGSGMVNSTDVALVRNREMFFLIDFDEPVLPEPETATEGVIVEGVITESLSTQSVSTESLVTTAPPDSTMLLSVGTATKAPVSESSTLIVAPAVTSSDATITLVPSDLSAPVVSAPFTLVNTAQLISPPASILPISLVVTSGVPETSATTGGVLNIGTVNAAAVTGCTVNYSSALVLQSPASVTASNVVVPLVLTAPAIEAQRELFLDTTSALACELITAEVLGTQGSGTVTIRPTGTPVVSDLSLNASSGVVAAAADRVFQDLSSQGTADLADLLPTELNSDEFAQPGDSLALGAALATDDWLAPV